MKHLGLLSLILLVGCYTPVHHLDEIVNDRQKIEFKQTSYDPHTSLDTFLQEVFTEEAYAAIKDIPVVVGPLAGGSGLASGTSFTSKIISFFMFFDCERRIVLSQKGLEEYGIEGVLHELTHQLDDMSRDGDANFIDVQQFLVGYKMCQGDKQHHGIIRAVEEKNPDNWISVFGVGDNAERIAFTSQFMWKQDASADLEYAFRKIYRKFQKKYAE